MNKIIERGKEPSTWAGLAGTLVALGVATEGQTQIIMTAVAGLLGVVAMLTREKGPA